jgi:riboflavin biosynthesis pyrimidine reductase
LGHPLKNSSTVSDRQQVVCALAIFSRPALSGSNLNGFLFHFRGFNSRQRASDFEMLITSQSRRDRMLRSQQPQFADSE